MHEPGMCRRGSTVLNFPFYNGTVHVANLPDHASTVCASCVHQKSCAHNTLVTGICRKCNIPEVLQHGRLSTKAVTVDSGLAQSRKLQGCPPEYHLLCISPCCITWGFLENYSASAHLPQHLVTCA